MEFIGILFTHWVGDFLLQSEKMATKKHNSLKWLLLHVLVYSSAIFVAAQLLFSWQIGLGYAIFNGLLHLVTDFFTSKLANHYQENTKVFYPILGFDQLIHLVCLYWTFINSDVLAL